MERLTVMLGTVLAVSAIVVVPALAQDVPEVPNEPVSEGPGDGLVKEEGPGTPADVPPPPDPLPSDSPPPDSPSPPEPPPPDSPPPDVPPPDSSLPDTPSLDTPPPDASPSDAPSPDSLPPPDIEDQKAGSGPDLKTDFQDFDGSGTAREAEEREAEDQGAEDQGAEDQEAEDQEAEIDDIGEAEDEKDEDEDEEDEKAGDPKQETEQDADSGDVDQSVDVINTGDNVNLCLGVLQSANTGNAQNAGGVVQDDSEADEIELDGGSSITITPQLIVDCRQIINQIVTVQTITGDNSASDRGARNLPGLGQLDLGTNKAALKSVGTSNLGLSKAAAGPRSLPRTGGGALLGLGAGVLLVSGGLLVRRIFR